VREREREREKEKEREREREKEKRERERNRKRERERERERERKIKRERETGGERESADEVNVRKTFCVRPRAHSISTWMYVRQMMRTETQKIRHIYTKVHVNNKVQLKIIYYSAASCRVGNVKMR
jgi:hypothetical protein